MMNLSLKFNKKDYYYLEKDYLDITSDKDNINSLEGIDEFTSKFSKDEIIESIKRSNIIATPELLENCNLVITYYENGNIREYKVFTNDDIEYLSLDIIEFLFKISEKKNILNQLNNYFSNKNYLPKDLVLFAKDLKDASITQIVDDYINLEYRSKRIFKVYVYSDILPKLEEKILIRNNKNANNLT